MSETLRQGDSADFRNLDEIGPPLAKNAPPEGRIKTQMQNRVFKSSMKLSILGCFGIVCVVALPSCVDPYYYGPSHPVTTYYPGHEVPYLPRGYRTEVIYGTTYYSYNGIYYRPRSGRYVVVEPPRGHFAYPPARHGVIRQLPPGCRRIYHHGAYYYQRGDVYYQQRGPGYVIVGRPY